MAQHPIPQQISSYEFKLVGEMTLKQFFKAAGGIGIALIINSTKMFWLFRWPLMLGSAGAGLAFAFFPFQDRPLEYWIVAFVKSIYSPTIFLYQRGDKKKVTENLVIDTTDKKTDDDSFDGKIRLINEKGKIRDFINSLPSVKLSVKIKESTAQDEHLLRAKKLKDAKPPGADVELVDLDGKPIELKVKAEPDWREEKANLGLKTEKLSATGKAVFGQIPMPDIPDVPNIIVGMVTNNAGRIVEGAIVEIQDQHGNPARVIKTNSLGQFRIASALQNGEYLIICEKEGLKFDRVNVDLSGKIVQPVKIISG